MKKIILAFVSLCAAQLAQAGFVSLNMFEKEGKKIVVCGDRHCDFENLAHADLEAIKHDKAHKELLSKFLEQCAQSDEPVAVLIESLPDWMDTYKGEYQTMKKYPQTFYLGMHVELPARGASVEKNAHYLPFDLRDAQFRGPVQFIHNLNDSLAILGKGSTSLEQDLPKELLKKVVAQVKKFDCYGTIQDYFDQIDTVNRLLQSESEQAKALTTYKKQAEAFFNGKDYTQKIVSTLADYVAEQNIPAVLSQCDWIFDLNSLVGDVSLTIGLESALEKYNKLFVFTGQAHAIDSCKKLCASGFTETEAYGYQTFPNLKQLTYLKPEQLKTLYKLFESSNESKEECSIEQPVGNVCAVCTKATNTKCSACKSVYYCSRNCQSSDWKQHKRICKK